MFISRADVVAEKMMCHYVATCTHVTWRTGVCMCVHGCVLVCVCDKSVKHPFQDIR